MDQIWQSTQCFSFTTGKKSASCQYSTGQLLQHKQIIRRQTWFVSLPLLWFGRCVQKTQMSMSNVNSGPANMWIGSAGMKGNCCRDASSLWKRWFNENKAWFYPEQTSSHATVSLSGLLLHNKKQPVPHGNILAGSRIKQHWWVICFWHIHEPILLFPHWGLLWHGMVEQSCYG